MTPTIPPPAAASARAAAMDPPITAGAAVAAPPARLVSLDVYRGFIMFVLAAHGFGLAKEAANHPGSVVWQFLAYQFDHVAWRGCGFWDLIQPAFMFMVGVAIPYSYASRKARGDSDGKIILHSLWRSLVLIVLAVFLASQSGTQTNWRFTNVLGQIGLGYTAVMLLRGRGVKTQLLALAGILIGYWLLFALYPASGSDFGSHWALRANAAHRFDVWFLNLFPGAKPFVSQDGGYQTLNFIPSMGTMLLGLMAGETLRSTLTDRAKLQRILGAAAVCFVLGIAADPSILPGVNASWTLCPIVKRIWTPSWTLFSAGWTLTLLGAFYWSIDMKGWRRWTFPFVVVGMNSIAIYLMGQLMGGWVRGQLRIHFGITHQIASAVAVAVVFWCICYWMYRRKIFLRI
ncbi:MAG: hypothetical protein Q7S40_14110 [Opitutaceae bacterium]|nr:hypothetical protein [Opitutaceae bacterium]